MTKQKRCLLLGTLFLTVVGCQRRPLIIDDPVGENCEIRFSAGCLNIADATTKAPALVALEAGSTVRVLAYQRTAAGQAAPDLTTDVWKATATYKVQSDGTTLVACPVDDDGNEVAPPAGETVKGMELGNGVYDFYAYSPARKLESDNRTVRGIGHGTDFLGAYVGAKTINRSSSSVELDFEHEATKVTFSVVPVDAADGGLTGKDLFADSVVMHSLATTPAGDYTLGGDLTPTVGGTADSGVMRTFAYIDDTDKGKGAKGSGIFLPKSVGEVPAEFYVQVGNVHYVLKATLPSMAFVKGYDYQFAARVKQGTVDLVLNILSWNAVDQTLTGFGGPNGTIHIGSWGNVDWNGSFGGNLDENSAPITVGTWTAVAQSVDFLGSNGGGNVSNWGQVGSGPEGIGQ